MNLRWFCGFLGRTLIVSLGVVYPAMSEPAYTVYGPPENGYFKPNTRYVGAATVEVLGTYGNSGDSGSESSVVVAYEDDENPSVECQPGYYLPTGSDTCSICDENHYCVGGENAVAQPCQSGLVSPSGTVSADNCGKMMYVGDDFLYLTQTQQTTPALAVRIDGTIYYARITPVSNGEKPMNINTTHSLQTAIDGVEYYIHDNTIQEEQ